MSLLQDLIQDDFGLEGRNRWFHSQEHDSLVFDQQNDRFFWNSQNIKGGALEYLIYVRGMEKAEARNFLNNYFGTLRENPESPQHVRPYEKLINLMWENGKSNRKYWYDRCLTDETIDRYQLGYYNEWYLVPIYRDGEFVNFQKRRDEPSKSMHYWYKTGEVYLFNEGILPYLTDKVVYITEGLVDCVLLNQIGLPSVSATGANTWRQEWFSKFSKIKEIVYLADYDNAGYTGAKSVADSLGVERVRIVTFDGKTEKYDTGDFFREHKDKDKLLSWIDNHSHYSFELQFVYDKIKKLVRERRKEFVWAK